MRYVKVEFSNTRNANDEYFYKDTLKTPLQEYDTVIVPTRYGKTLAIVTAINQTPEQFPVYVTCSSVKVVDEKIKSKTFDKINKAKRAKAIEKKLEGKIQELDALTRYQAYADDPAVAELLKELKSLSK
jgi:hypothetical protein